MSYVFLVLVCVNQVQYYRSSDPHWTKFAINGVLVEIAEGAFVFLVTATPLGWIAIIIVATATAGVMMGLDHVVDKYAFTG